MPDAEATAKQTLDRFITEWNTADDANLREVLNFPVVSVAGGGGLVLDRRPEDFSQGFEQTQERGWRRRSFDFDAFTVVKLSPDKVHAEVGFSRYGADGAAYLTSWVFYILTQSDDH